MPEIMEDAYDLLLYLFASATMAAAIVTLVIVYAVIMEG